MGRKNKSKRKVELNGTENVSVKRVKKEFLEDGELQSERPTLGGRATKLESNPQAEPEFLKFPPIYSSCISTFVTYIDIQKPILVAGPVGCGKTYCIDYVATVRRASICRVQISEQIDSKSLLGAYCCTEVPGQFVWRRGPLLNSLTEGAWLVLEDVDRGPADLQMLLAPLLNPRLHSSSGCHVDITDPTTGLSVTKHPNFRLIMTRRLVLSHTDEWRLECDNQYSDFIDRHSSLVILPALNEDNLRQLISKLYPSLHHLLDRIMMIYDCARKGLASNSSVRSRTTSPRDLLKFCARINRLPVESMQSEALLLHAVDCFVASVSDSAQLVRMASQIAGELNLTTEKVMCILYKRTVDLRLDPDAAMVYLGRAQLPCHRTAEWEARLSSGVTVNQTTGDAVSPFASTHLACTLLERLAVAVAHREPVLLVGETGTGKTSAIQQLAHLCGRRLRVINLNQQSDSVDLLGGFKPVDTRSLVRPVRERFEAYFCRTFKMDKNLDFLGHINDCFNEGRWRDLITLMQHPARLAVERSAGSAQSFHEEWLGVLDQLDQLQRRFEAAVKNQSAVGFAFIEGALIRALQDGDWVLLDEINLAPAEMLDCLSGLLDSERGSLTLVERGDKQPLKRNPDFHLFAAMNPSTDVGKRELPVGLRNRFTEIYVPELDPGVNDAQSDPIRSTDREDLGILIRAYLLPLNPSPTQITTVVRLYAALRQAALEGLVDGVGQKPHFSLRTLCRALVEAGRGYHGSTIRSLYEGLIFSFGSQLSRASRPVLDMLIRRYLALAHGSRGQKTDPNSLSPLLASPLPMPGNRPKAQPCTVEYLHVEGYWVPRGPGEPRQTSPDALVDGSYVLTPSVRANLKDLARVVAAGGSLPVLLQGETSVGKTSLITYLAERIGQVCYRINNHEHTEQQTYLGTYTVASATAQATAAKDGSPPPLVFQHGPLVQAMRLGHWIILDELNLAPTEILEALNRVLDDNRTLFIPDTQEVIRAHPQFRLFATQNPPGLYAGRKVLSRALRNRFIELHFDPIPRGELEVILEKRCSLPQSRAHRLVEVMHRLQLARCQSNVFLGKDSFITLRDLFRWAERYRLATCDLVDPENDVEKRVTFFDWDAYLAEQGYLLLAGRVRNAEEARIVADALEAVFKRPISESKLFDLSEETSPVSIEFLQPLLSQTDRRPVGFEHVVWTREMRRMLVLVGNALKYKEPVLLIGETSCGKTTVCQLFASLKQQQLHCVNCHQYTEAGDFLGGLRPVRRVQSQDGKEAEDGRLFEWVDGPLVVAMSRGEMFLLDEISLADDAVLERLNSLLEPERRLNLAERSEGAGSIGVLETNELTAHTGFRLVATMNPGGDYGKKELSPALRNRFTEIWCPTPAFTTQKTEATSPPPDLKLIVAHNLELHLPDLRSDPTLIEQLSYAMVEFTSWFSSSFHDESTSVRLMSTRRSPPTIRDLLAWIQFMKSACSQNALSAKSSSSIDVLGACLHGASLIFLDAVDSSPDCVLEEPGGLAVQGLKFLQERLERIAVNHGFPVDTLLKAASYVSVREDASFSLTPDRTAFGADPFYIETGPSLAATPFGRFNFSAPTPAINLRRLLRALQVPKRALLLEGSPGVGKTSLVLALAKAAGHEVVRINLSEATEASDLLGCDLPVEGAAPGVFAWRDGPLLQGLREGRWIVLDEMNLASQSVLECLNACLDHRGELYIPELGATFKIKPGTTRLFACQNPVREGGGRKGLPKSFLNRFTQVFLQPLTKADQEFIMSQLYPQLSSTVVQLMVEFNWRLNDKVNNAHEFGTQGGPWEFNLRDLMRWAELIIKGEKFEGLNPGLYVHFVYTDRMRTAEDKQKVIELWREVCGDRDATDMVYYKPLGRISIVDHRLRVGTAGFDTIPNVTPSTLPNLLFLDHLRGAVESLLKILEMGWMAILVGPPGCGKRTLISMCAALVGHPISTMYMSPTADTVELLGSLEQHEAGGHFAWIDSPLVTGIRQGHWVVIENAQLCSPSVLDRLNSVLEPDGELVLSERGLDSNGQLIRLKPHPNFRLILIVDEGSGAGSTGVSRAMRNRGIEIAMYKDLTVPTLDLERMLTATGTRDSVIHALTLFQTLFATACGLSNLSSTEYAKLLDDMPISAGLLKRPPVGALLLCCHLAERLLQNPASTDMEPRQLFPAGDEVDAFQTFELKRPKTVWCWAVARALNFAYTSRQTHGKAVNFIRKLITRFVSVMSEKIPIQSISQGSECSVPRYLIHSLYEVVHCRSPVHHRQTHAHAVALALDGVPSFPARLIRRIILEQANLDDLRTLPTHLQAIFSPMSATLDWSSDSLPQAVSDLWIQWPDLRWIPGWQYLTEHPDESLYAWDKILRVLLAVELVQLMEENLPRKSKKFKNSEPISLLSVLHVAHQSATGQIPTTWLDSYAGLNTLLDSWTQFLKAFIEDQTSVSHRISAHSSWLAIAQRVGLVWTWLSQFLLKPIGDPVDWSDRLSFHNERAKLSNVERSWFIPVLNDIRSTLSVPAPRMSPPSNSELTPVTLNWVSFGQKIGEVLQLLQMGDLEEEDEDDEDEDQDLVTNEQDKSIVVHQDSVHDNHTANFVCLWPLSMLNLLELSNPDSCHSEDLRVLVRCRLLSMTRPHLLSLLSIAQPCHLALGVQKRAFERSPLEISDHQALEQLCTRLDLVSTGRLLPFRSFGALERPSLIMEWRSLGQATFALTWPALSQFNMCAYSTKQTLFGWLNSQKAYKIAHVMLSSCTRGLQDATASQGYSSTTNVIKPTSDFNELVQKSSRLLGSIYQALVTRGPSSTQLEAFLPSNSSILECDQEIGPLLDWVQSNLQPILSNTASLPSEWMELFGLCQSLLSCLSELRCNPSNQSLVGIIWTIFGCLYARCACPVSPLDPYLVAQFEEDAVANELMRVEQELELRRSIRRISFGDPSGALPSDDDLSGCFSAATLQGLVAAGLEHPWISALVTYREQLTDQAKQLAEHNALSHGTVPVSRQSSNVQYSQLRRRLSNFVLGFTDKLLLARHSHQTNIPQLNAGSIDRWLEVASDLGEWLTEPGRFNTFADIVEPFLHGLLAILRGLRIWTHFGPSVSNLESTTITDLIGLLSTGLLSNRQVIDRPISITCPSIPLYLACQLTDASVQNTFKRVAITASLGVESSQVNNTLPLQMEFRLFSFMLDLIWLHHIDSSCVSRSAPLVGRLLAFLNRPLARRWQQAEADRKKAAADRAALFIEAASRKHRIQGELQQQGTKTKKAVQDEQSDLIDPDLVEEVEWRLRFPETASLSAMAEMNAEARRLGLGREDQIQQTVRKLEDVDKWLKRALEETSRNWIPDESELVYWVDRMVELLIPQTTNIVADEQHKSDWRWHTLLSGYSMASWLTVHGSVSLDPSMDAQSLPTLLATTAYLAQTDLRSRTRLPTQSSRKPSLDVYRDPIPLEAASKLLAVVERLEHRVRQLLHEWPGQPSLVRLLTLIRRLEGFCVSDPLMKFVTGVEMIWQEMHEWEKNASRHVSLMDQIKEVCELLIDWRKLELKCWLSTLDTATVTFANRAATMWFHLHNVFLKTSGRTPSKAGTVQSEADRCEVLVELMENGPLGEFVMRWRLLVALRAALDIWPDLSPEDRETSKRIVGNVIWFYGQFLPAVQNEIKSLRKPIEKELRGIVHITKWGDYACFWSVKSNVDRCKKTIHKQVRNWETLLRRPVRPLFETAMSVPRLEQLPDSSYSLSLPPRSSDPKTYWLSPQDFQWLCEQRADNPKLSSLFRRLPTLVSKFHIHLRRMASGSPVTHWMHQLHAGTDTWTSLLTDLETSTRQLESTCPAAHLLRQIHAAKSNTKRKASGDDTEELNRARQWHQLFTTLQQRKRWALSQWFKVAGTTSKVSIISTKEGMDNSLSPAECDSTPDCPDTEALDVEVELGDDSSMPQLGLSYLRGQRFSHTGSMTTFLAQLSGDPWKYVEMDAISELHQIKSSEGALSTTVCKRLACLIALRGGLPPTPGPPGATAETISAIITELGGPTNLARLIGLTDDLLNHCVVALRDCSQLTEAANQFTAQTQAFRASFTVDEHSPSRVEEEEEVLYASFGSNKAQIRKFRSCVMALGQLTRDAVQHCTLFWNVCHQLQQSATPVTTNDLRQVFGSEIWDKMIAHAVCPSTELFTEFCQYICTSHLDRLTAAVGTISHLVTLLATSPIFLLTRSSYEQCVQLSTAVESFFTMTDTIVSECQNRGFHNIVEWTLVRITERMRTEYNVLSRTLAENPLLPLYSEERLNEESDCTFESLTNGLIQNILRTLETLYQADQQPEDMGQIDLLLHFANQMSNTASNLILGQVSKSLTRLRLRLEQSESEKLVSRLRLSRVIFPLIEALSKAIEVRVTQFWHLLNEWTRLGERVLRVTGRLLVDGFCRPAGLDRSLSDGSTEGVSSDNQASDAQEGSGGGTSLTAQGVDTTGAKDVSNELECQEQIEGLMDDARKPDQADDDREAPEDESEGIEMPDDNFQGEFGEDQPLEVDEQENEEDSTDEAQDLENRMGDGAGAASDELSKKMWASDDEDEEKEEEDQSGNKNPPTENEAGGVQDQNSGQQDEKVSKDSSEVQKHKKSSDADPTEQEENDDANNPEADSTPPPKKRPKSTKDLQDRTTVAGEEGQMLPNDEQESMPEAENERDQADNDDQERKDEEALAALEAQRLQDEEETTTEQTEDLPDDLPDESINSPADADSSAKPEEEEHKDEPDPGFGEQSMPFEQETEEQAEGQDSNLEAFQYNPASGDLGTDQAMSGSHDANATDEEKRLAANDVKQDSAEPMSEPSEQSSSNRGKQRVGSRQFGDSTPSQLDSIEDSASKSESSTSERRRGPKPVSDTRTQDPNATDAKKKKEVLDAARPNQDRSSEVNQDDVAELFEHMPEGSVDTGDDSQPRVFDSATEAQRKKQTRSEQERDQLEKDVGVENDEESMDQPELLPTEADEDRPASSTLPLQKRHSETVSKSAVGGEDIAQSDPNAETVPTLGAQRPPESFICTRPEAVVPLGTALEPMDTEVERADLRSVSVEEAKEAFFEWSACSARSAGLARQLCESLRLVLEPTKAARMRGDYRTGKRINMRKIIPYLASHFRKDKIWLRRSQPSQREYRILIAVDDSSSMSDNLCRQMTFDALATVVTALNLLEVGRIGVCSFGESVRILHDLQDTWVGDAGAQVLTQFTFKQPRTSLIQLLKSAIRTMQMCNLPTTTGTTPSQLLLILSDGVFSEDPQDPKVQAAVRLARDSRLFPVCLILDDVRKKHSIFDLRRYTSNGKLVPYMDTFPLPFYLVLRDVTALPQLLSDALRQWFELEASFGS